MPLCQAGSSLAGNTKLANWQDVNKRKLKMCKSNCTGEVLEFHSVGVMDLGEEQCMECKCTFTKIALRKAMQARFGDNAEAKLAELKAIRKDVKRRVRKARKNGYAMAETIYFIDPPVNANKHDGEIVNGKHVYKDKKKMDRYKDIPPEMYTTVYILGDYDVHE